MLQMSVSDMANVAVVIRKSADHWGRVSVNLTVWGETLPASLRGGARARRGAVDAALESYGRQLEARSLIREWKASR